MTYGVQASSDQTVDVDSEIGSITFRYAFHSRAKRAIDICLAAILLLLAAPVLVLLYAIVRLDGGPGLFRHKRIGALGREFMCLKYRTMKCDSDRILADAFRENPSLEKEWRETQKLRDDPRVTPVGRVLRALSLDEVPQLLNVLAGDMSLVGPRPITSAEVARYGRNIHAYYAVRPGITGLWQVSGRSTTTYDRRVELDVTYAEEWSLRRDINIMLQTVPVVLSRVGAS